MNPLLTLWPSGHTAMLALKAAMYVKGTPDLSDMYAELTCDGMTVSALAERIRDEHRRLIALTAPDSILHTVAVMPLYRTDVADCLDMLVGAADSLTVGVSLHVVGLRRDLAQALNDEPDEPDVEAANIALLDRVARDGHRSFSYSIISDYASNGASFAFTLNALSAYIGVLFTTLIRDYYAVLPPMLATTNSGRNIALGMSSIRYDREEMCKFLLNRAFTSALDAAGVNRTNVDAQRAADRAQRLLEGISGRYTAFVDREIMPEACAGTLSEDQIAAHAVPLLKAEVDNIRTELSAVLTDSELTFPEREAVMALIIGRDNPRLRGIQYDHEIRLLDDACSEPVQLYINSFNAFCRPSDILPVRGDFQALKEYVTNSDTGQISESDSNALAFDPLPDIKRLKLDILNTTELIRRKTDELDSLTHAEADRRASQGESDGYPSYPGRPDIPLPEVVEQPLDETYQPSPTLQRRRSVDLRQFFSPVRNQGQLGACSTFATVSMYEAIMNRFSPGLPPADLSERFVYYYSNVMMRKPDGGSNYYDQLAVLGKHGVCSERLFGYSTTDIEGEPPADAVADAAGHRVLKAMQIPLRQTGGKAICLAENHRLLTSALSEGYPVGIALEIYPSFGKNGPFINRPDENDFSTNQAGHHAMVLAGYSEDDKCYIVRNSWGTDFGDKGYCYISAAYVDDSDLNSFACIIAETTESKRGGGAEIPGVVAPFAGSEMQIRMAAIRNILDEAHVFLDSYRKLYDEYYRYYQRLLQRLCIPQVRKAIRVGAELHTTGELTDIESRKKTLTDAFATDIADYRAACCKIALGATGIAMLAIGAAWLLKSTVTWGIAALLSALAIILWLNIKWNTRRRRNELNARIGDLASQAAATARDLAEKQLRFHVAGMWLDCFHELSIELGTTYDRLVSFNSHLRAWHAEDSRATESQTVHDCNTFVYLDFPDRLETFFMQNIDSITARIDLDGAFAEYAAGREDSQDARERLRRSTLEAIHPLFADFSIADYLLGRTYPYLEPIDIDKAMGQLYSLSQPSSRNTAVMPIPPSLLLVAEVHVTHRSEWVAAVNRALPYHPTPVASTDPTALDLITILPMP